MTDSKTLMLWVPPGETALPRALSEVEAETALVHDAAMAAERLHDADALVVSAAHMSHDFLARIGSDAPRLRWLHLTSAGYDNVAGRPLPEGLQVTYTPGAGAAAVAEHGMALMLALARALPQSLDNQRAQRWDYGVGARTRALQGRTALILGFGHIGKAVARLADAFGMRVIAVSRSGTESSLAAQSCTLADADRHLPDADFVVVAAPLVAETERYLDARRLALIGREAFLVNLSRGAIVDGEALAARLRLGKMAGAALDVTDPEPLPAGHPLWSAPNLILTPHTAATGAPPSDCARLIAIATENARRFVRHEPLLHLVDCRMRQAA